MHQLLNNFRTTIIPISPPIPPKNTDDSDKNPAPQRIGIIDPIVDPINTPIYTNVLRDIYNRV